MAKQSMVCLATPLFPKKSQESILLVTAFLSSQFFPTLHLTAEPKTSIIFESKFQLVFVQHHHLDAQCYITIGFTILY